jgi:uncharacterized protein
MKSPFYQIFIENSFGTKREITEYITGFDYEDCLQEDDMLTLKITDKSFEFLEKEEVKVGKTIFFKFGYIGGLVSELHQTRITDVETTYAELVTITIKAYDLGTVMKKATEQVIWKWKKSSEIAKEIAEKYGLTPIIEETQRVYASLPQGKKTDFQFLKYLASIEQNGSFRFFIKDNELHFDKTDLAQNAKRLYTYRNNGFDANVISFKPSLRESTQQSDASELKMVGFDPLKQQTQSATVNNSNSKDDTKLGNSVPKYDAYGKQISAGISSVKNKKEAKSTNSTPMPDFSLGAISDKANHSKKKSSEKILVATLMTEGDPTLKADEVVTVSGVAKIHSGNWYIEKIKHTISFSGYINTIELTKNAFQSKTISNGVNGVQTANINKSVGKKSNEQTKVIPRYDANSKQIN